MKRIPITIGFDERAVVGYAELKDDFEMDAENSELLVGYIKKEDGSTKIMQISVVAVPVLRFPDE